MGLTFSSEYVIIAYAKVVMEVPYRLSRKAKNLSRIQVHTSGCGAVGMREASQARRFGSMQAVSCREFSKTLTTLENTHFFGCYPFQKNTDKMF